MLRKIDIFSDPRKPAYLNFEAGAAPLKNPVPPGTINRVRAHRHQRLKDQVIEHDCAAILLYDPLNIRYATDCSDMQVWTMHNPARYVLLCADGPTICLSTSRQCIWPKGSTWSMKCVRALPGSIS